MEPHVRYNLYRRNILCQSWSLSLTSENAGLLVEVPSPHIHGVMNRTVERSLFRTPLLSTYNALRAAEDCFSTSELL